MDLGPILEEVKTCLGYNYDGTIPPIIKRPKT